MGKAFLIVAGLVFGAAGAQAQDTLQVQGITPDLYLMHTVGKGENFYSLGRAYGLSPKEIAALNNLSFERGLQLGQQVKIPLTAANFQQSAAAAGARPVYHKVAEKETLYRISVNHNKVPIDNIRQWNHLSGDGLKKGSYVIVGWVKGTGSAVSAPATAAVAPAAPTPSGSGPIPAPPANTGAARQEQPSGSITPAPPVITPAPPVQQDATVKRDSNISASGNTASSPVPVSPAPAPPAPVSTAPVSPAPAAPAATAGAFEQLYMEQTANGKHVTTEKGPGSWFKSNAGPGKYYALHNSAARGTIIKVTNPLNGKYIYAKVLEAIPQMKQNAGLIIKLSDSALEALGTNEAKFYCELSYEN